MVSKCALLGNLQDGQGEAELLETTARVLILAGKVEAANRIVRGSKDGRPLSFIILDFVGKASALTELDRWFHQQHIEDTLAPGPKALVAQERQRKGAGKGSWRPNQPKGGVAFEGKPQILAQTLFGEDYYLSFELREEFPWDAEDPDKEFPTNWDMTYITHEALRDRMVVLAPILSSNLMWAGLDEEDADEVDESVLSLPAKARLPDRYSLRWKDWLTDVVEMTAAPGDLGAAGVVFQTPLSPDSALVSPEQSPAAVDNSEKDSAATPVTTNAKVLSQARTRPTVSASRTSGTRRRGLKTSQTRGGLFGSGSGGGGKS